MEPAAVARASVGHWAELRATLEHCSSRVGLYRGRPGPDPALPDEEACQRALADYPVLTREALRAAFPTGLVPSGRALGEAVRSGLVSFNGTSGSTGERVQVLWHQPWYDAQERAGFAAHALARALVGAPGYREAVLTTPVCSGNICHARRLPMSERIVEDRVLFLNDAADPGLWSDADVQRMADELDAFRPTALEADPAWLAFLSARWRGLGRAPWQPRFIDLSYELASRRHLAAIAASFPGVPLIDAYGSTECGFVFCACAAGRLHPNLSWSHPELLPLDDLPGLEGVSRLVVTPLRNEWLNLVRFETGDLVRLAAGPCPCGLSEAPVLAAIEGRAADVLRAADGRLLTPRAVDDALAGLAGVLHYRLRERGPGAHELELLPDGSTAPEPEAARAALAPLLGAPPQVLLVSAIAVEASGKFRLCQPARPHLPSAVRA